MLIGDKARRSPLRSYQSYIRRLQILTNEGALSSREAQVADALNGEPTAELHRVVSLATRRRYGAYFTGSTLSDRLVGRSAFLKRQPVFYDPSCGMGDLLLAAAKTLPLADRLGQTLTLWSRLLAGNDIHPEFIEGTKLRLVLLAACLHRTAEIPSNPVDAFFPHISVGDGLVGQDAFEKATTLLMNPPFGLVPAPSNCGWAAGRVSEAATFLVNALERVRPQTEVLAILPDVLRSGSFSKRWRGRVSDLAEVHLIESFGVFDKSADVDVFILRLVRRDKLSPERRAADKRKSAERKRWPTQPKPEGETVSDCFDVHIGRIVPHRDKELGPAYPYIHARSAPRWTVMREFSETRRSERQAFKPPFLVVRRTSRPDQPHRAVATIIAGRRPVTVENHLIVCEPKDKRLKTCRDLMKQLRTETVNNFLNQRIRCRHLTVSAVGAIPFETRSNCEE